jgi:EthD domain
MEKVVVALWAREGESRTDFARRLLPALPLALADAGARDIRLNLRDQSVERAAGLVQQWQSPQQDAVVQFWLPSANPHFRGPVDSVLAAHSTRFAAWLVAESVIIPNTAHPAPSGQRGWGWSQASFISFLPNLSRRQAIDVWHNHHTRVAIDTQANFEYVQNLIVCPLTDDAPAYDAFVEERFPDEAMDKPAAFFDAVGDEAKFKANLATMMDSCGRFIDFARIDIIPTAWYEWSDRR